jgi:hypothetical protein
MTAFSCQCLWLKSTGGVIISSPKKGALLEIAGKRVREAVNLMQLRRVYLAKWRRKESV